MTSSFGRTTSGFTIIEMVVVLAIISITSSVVINTLSTGRAIRVTEQATHDLAGALRQAQNFALTGRYSSQESCYFGLRLISNSQYALVNYYRSGGNCTSYNTLTTTNLPNGVTFSGISSYPVTFVFSLPRAEVSRILANGTISSLATAQLFRLTKSGRTQYLCLYPGGRIEERGTTGTCP